MSRIGFLYAIVAAILFGVGGSLAQFLFQQRGVDTGWLVTMRLLVAGTALLAISTVRQGRQVLAVLDDPETEAAAFHQAAGQVSGDNSDYKNNEKTLI